MHGRVFTFFALLVLLPAGTALAQDSDTRHDNAVAEFTLGRVKFEAGDCAGAIPHFVKSLEFEQNVGARFNLAVCSAREGRNAEAWNHYKAAEQLAIAKHDTKRVDLAHAGAAELDGKVTKVRLVLPATTLKTSIDGVVVPQTDQWLLGRGYALEPSVPHSFVVELPNQPAWVRRDVKGDAGIELPAMVVEVVRPKETVVIREELRTPPLRTASYVIGVTGLATLAVGGTFAILAASARSDAKSACESDGYAYPGACNPLRKAEIDPANDSAQTRAGIATGLTIAGGTLLGAAVVTFLLSRPAVTRTRGPSVSIAPTGGGAVVAGSF